jgi:hypothetical protein
MCTCSGPVQSEESGAREDEDGSSHTPTQTQTRATQRDRVRQSESIPVWECDCECDCPMQNYSHLRHYFLTKDWRPPHVIWHGMWKLFVTHFSHHLCTLTMYLYFIYSINHAKLVALSTSRLSLCRTILVVLTCLQLILFIYAMTSSNQSGNVKFIAGKFKISSLLHGKSR